MRFEAFPMQPSIGVDGVVESLKTQESWRERQPIPIFINEPYIIAPDNIVAGESTIADSASADELLIALEPVRRQVFEGLAKGLSYNFEGITTEPKPVVNWQPGKELNLGEEENLVIFNPVYLGPVSRGLEGAFGQNDLESFKLGLRCSTPEVEWPLSATIANEMGIKPAHPNFVNMIFIQDSDHQIDRLTADQRVALSRSLFAGLGSWKADIVTYSIDGNGVAYLNNVTMATLEGGHPAFGPADLDELGWRHKVLASTKPVDVHKIPANTEQTISFDDWQNSASVEGIRASGRMLGDYRLLSDSVKLEQLVSNERLARMLTRLANFSQQGEGALFAWDPKLGKLIVSCTGQLGAVKSNLQINEVVAIVDLSTPDKKAIGMVPVEGLKLLKPSVEGPEFGYPMWELLRDHPVWLDQTNGGYLLAGDGEGQYMVPPIRAGGHLHRGIIPTNSSRVFHLDTDPTKWPPVGCGADASDEYSHHVFREAVELLEKSGRTIEFVTYPVHGHSTNYLQFYVAGRTNPANHAESLAEVLDSGEMKFTPDVPQVAQRIIPAQSQ